MPNGLVDTRYYHYFDICQSWWNLIQFRGRNPSDFYNPYKYWKGKRRDGVTLDRKTFNAQLNEVIAGVERKRVNVGHAIQLTIYR